MNKPTTKRIRVQWDQGEEGDEWNPETVPPTLVDIPLEVYERGYIDDGAVADWLADQYGSLVYDWRQEA